MDHFIIIKSLPPPEKVVIVQRLMSSEKNINVNKEQPEQDEVIRLGGFTLSALIALASVSMAKSIIDNTSKNSAGGFSWFIMTSDIGCILMTAYFVLSCAIPTYLLGRPEKWKIAPLVLGGFLTFIAGILAIMFSKFDKDIYFYLEFLSPIPFVACGYFVHLLDDDEKSVWLMLKPWRKNEVLGSTV